MTAMSAMRRISLTLFLTGCAVGLHFAAGLRPRLDLQFHALSMSNVYRVVTCHWLHWSADHLIWDLVVFAVLGAMCEWRSPRSYLGTVLLSAIAIPLCVMHWLPEVGSYRGLSGIDTALFGLLVSGLLVQRTKDHDWSGTLLFAFFLIGLSGKITMETISHTNIFVSDTSFVPVPLAHLVGAIIGVATGVSEWLVVTPKHKFRQQTEFSS